MRDEGVGSEVSGPDAEVSGPDAEVCGPGGLWSRRAVVLSVSLPALPCLLPL